MLSRKRSSVGVAAAPADLMEGSSPAGSCATLARRLLGLLDPLTLHGLLVIVVERVPHLLHGHAQLAGAVAITSRLCLRDPLLGIAQHPPHPLWALVGRRQGLALGREHLFLLAEASENVVVLGLSRGPVRGVGRRRAAVSVGARPAILRFDLGPLVSVAL